MSGGSGARIQFPAQQAILRFSAAITQNQWYDAFTGLACAAGAGSVKKNCSCSSISLDQATANEDLEVRLIIDDLDETLTQAATAATNYYVRKSGSPDTLALLFISTSDTSNDGLVMIAGRSVQIMYRKTSATGANNTTIKTCITLVK